MRRGRHSRSIPQAPPCGLCFLGKWLMSYGLKRNLSLRPTNRPLDDLKEFSTIMATGINDLPATSPHGSDFGDHAQIVGLASSPNARRGTAMAHRDACCDIPRPQIGRESRWRFSAACNVHDKRNCLAEREFDLRSPSPEQRKLKIQVLHLVSLRSQKPFFLCLSCTELVRTEESRFVLVADSNAVGFMNPKRLSPAFAPHRFFKMLHHGVPPCFGVFCSQLVPRSVPKIGSKIVQIAGRNSRARRWVKNSNDPVKEPNTAPDDFRAAD